MQKIELEELKLKSIPLNSPLEKRLFNIFNATVKEELRPSDLQNRYQGLTEVNLFFLKHRGRDIGFAMISFYKIKKNNRVVYVARPAMGILNSSRGARFPMKSYIKAFINFKMRHPFQEVCMFTCPVNPIPYAASSKYWVDSFPKHNRAYPNSVKATKEATLDFFGIQEIKENVIQLPFGPLLDEQDINRFYERKASNLHVAYFLEQNPNFLKNESLILMIPVSFKNIAHIFALQFKAMLSKVLRFKKIRAISNNLPKTKLS